MKMKNTIRADRSGIVTNVPISPGQSVKHKQVLVEFED
jgi:biotin carboxyl carrier protein